MKECPYCGLEIVGSDDVHEHCDAEYQEEYSSYRDMMTSEVVDEYFKSGTNHPYKRKPCDTCLRTFSVAYIGNDEWMCTNKECPSREGV